MVTTMVFLLVLAGCRLAGGGRVASVVTGHDAQFSFNLNCSGDGPASGVLTYIDRAAGVAIRATPTGPCMGFTFSGTYVTQPPFSPGSGSFKIILTPSKKQHPRSGQYSLTLTGTGIPGGTYSNSGTVDGNVVLIG